MTKSKGIMGPRVPWTEKQLGELRRRYPDEKAQVIADDLGMKLQNVYRVAKRLGLEKSDAFKAGPDASRFRRDDHPGKEFQFKPGQVPANKGKKSPGLAIGRMGETQFKGGRLPHNTQPIGSHKFDKDGTLLQKVREVPGNNSKRWRSVHELVWVEANGPLPAKHIVIFKPGMRTTVLEEITIDKVECLSMAEHMRRNTRHNYPKEINELIGLQAQITRQINKREKNEQ